MSQMTTPKTPPAAAPPVVTKDEALEMAPALIEYYSDRYLISSSMVVRVMMNTAFKPKKDEPPITMSQMLMLMTVAKLYGLNPFTREIYAFPKDGGIVPIVGVDGWVRIIRERPELNGFKFKNGPLLEVESPVKPFEWIECEMFRKDNEHPTLVTEYYSECYRPTNPWKEMPKRMLRHKSLIQAARYTFGFAGIYDEDEGQIIAYGGMPSNSNDDVEKLPNGRVHHRKPRQLPPLPEDTPAAPAQDAEDSTTKEPKPRDQKVVDVVDGVAKPVNPNDDILRQELIEEMEAVLNAEDATQKDLADLGERLGKPAVQDRLGKDEHARLKAWWIKVCEGGEVKEQPAPGAKKRLF